MAACPSCGGDNREGARFCDSCGQGDWVPWAWSLSTTAAHFPVVSNVGSGDAFEIRRYNAGASLEDPTAVTIRYGFAVVGDR
jgi:hypothetical protein